MQLRICLISLMPYVLITCGIHASHQQVKTAVLMSVYMPLSSALTQSRSMEQRTPYYPRVFLQCDGAYSQGFPLKLWHYSSGHIAFDLLQVLVMLCPRTNFKRSTYRVKKHLFTDFRLWRTWIEANNENMYDHVFASLKSVSYQNAAAHQSTRRNCSISAYALLSLVASAWLDRSGFNSAWGKAAYTAFLRTFVQNVSYDNLDIDGMLHDHRCKCANHVDDRPCQHIQSVLQAVDRVQRDMHIQDCMMNLWLRKSDCPTANIMLHAVFHSLAMEMHSVLPTLGFPTDPLQHHTMLYGRKKKRLGDEDLAAALNTATRSKKMSACSLGSVLGAGATERPSRCVAQFSAAARRVFGSPGDQVLT